VFDRRLDVADEQPPQPDRSECVHLHRLLGPLEETRRSFLHHVEEQLFLAPDVGVERAALDAEGIAEVLHARAVIAALGEQLRRRRDELGTAGAANLLGYLHWWAPPDFAKQTVVR
jgi:hypothetical protein